MTSYAPGSYVGLTRKQAELLSYIRAYQASHNGVPPSFEEMKEGSSLKSKSGIFRLVSALEERGYLRRLRSRARSIEVFDEPSAQYLAAGALSTETLVRELKRRGFVFKGRWQ